MQATAVFSAKTIGVGLKPNSFSRRPTSASTPCDLTGDSAPLLAPTLSEALGRPVVADPAPLAAIVAVDLLEAALHMDLVEATRVVYEAVWSDPSDPSKTYQNAAGAVLTELRKRAGISAVLGPLQPLAH